MTELFQDPFLQSTFLPALAALTAALVLRPFGAAAAGLGFVIGFLVSVVFVAGWQWQPLTSTRKIVLLGGVAAVLGLLCDWAGAWRPRVLAVLALLAGCGALWVGWRILARLDGWDRVLAATAVVAYTAWLAVGVAPLRDRPGVGVSALLALALGTSVSAVLGASALLGQLAGAAAAASGALLLVLMLFPGDRFGYAFYYSAGLLSGLIGVAAVLVASVPWYALIPLAFVPALARLPVPAATTRRELLRQLLVINIYVLPPVMVAIGLLFYLRGAPAV